MISTDVILGAARQLMLSNTLDELEDQHDRDDRASLPDKFDDVEDFLDFVMEENKLNIINNVSQLVGQISNAWECDVSLVFHHMGFNSEEKQIRGLYLLLMGCMGHGTGLNDDHSKELDDASKILKRKFEDAPISYGSENITCLVDRFLVYEEVK